jgi:steroid 5-alpha reductase family enzyme
VSPRARGLLAQAIAYAVALACAWAVVRFGPIADPLWNAALADVVATIAIFGFSVALSNSSMYDPYWSVAPPVLGAYWIMERGEPPNARTIVLMAITILWGVRLTWNFFRGWPGFPHEDWRYVDLRKKHGRAYWIVSFFGIHFFPTVLTFAGSVALFIVIHASARPFGVLDLIAASIALGGLAIETIADAQLRRFKRSKPTKGDFLDEGLWRYSRHPNYFGEITFWWGLGLGAVAADPSAWWILAAPLAIFLLFVFISIPMIDQRMRARRPSYAAHEARVSALIFWPRRD